MLVFDSVYFIFFRDFGLWWTIDSKDRWTCQQFIENHLRPLNAARKASIKLCLSKHWLCSGRSFSTMEFYKNFDWKELGILRKYVQPRVGWVTGCRKRSKMESMQIEFSRCRSSVTWAHFAIRLLFSMSFFVNYKHSNVRKCVYSFVFMTKQWQTLYKRTSCNFLIKWRQ